MDFLKGMFRRSNRVYIGTSPKSGSRSKSASKSRSSSMSRSSESSASRRSRQKTRKNRLNTLRENLINKYDELCEHVEELRQEWIDISYDKEDKIKKDAAYKNLKKAEKERKKIMKQTEPIEDLTEAGLDIFEKIEDDTSLSKEQKRTLKKRYTTLNAAFKNTLGKGSARNDAEVNRTMKELDDFEEMVKSGNIHM